MPQPLTSEKPWLTSCNFVVITADSGANGVLQSIDGAKLQKQCNIFAPPLERQKPIDRRTNFARPRPHSPYAYLHFNTYSKWSVGKLNNDVGRITTGIQRNFCQNTGVMCISSLNSMNSPEFSEHERLRNNASDSQYQSNQQQHTQIHHTLQPL